MRWLIFLVLLTIVWFLVHLTGAARQKMDNHRRSLPPETPAGVSIFPGMIVMPLGFLSLAVVVDKYAAPWGYRIVTALHLIIGIVAFSYIVVTIVRPRRIYGRA